MIGFMSRSNLLQSVAANSAPIVTHPIRNVTPPICSAASSSCFASRGFIHRPSQFRCESSECMCSNQDHAVATEPKPVRGGPAHQRLDELRVQCSGRVPEVSLPAIGVCGTWRPNSRSPACWRACRPILVVACRWASSHSHRISAARRLPPLVTIGWAKAQQARGRRIPEQARGVIARADGEDEEALAPWGARRLPPP